MNNLIYFLSNRPWLKKDSPSVPTPIIKTIPDWYREADRFAKMPNGEFYKASRMVCPYPKEGTTDDYGLIPTWKACPSMFDIMGTGYSLNLPCDIEFIEKDDKTLIVNIEDKRYKDFCTPRAPMGQFKHPMGYYENHFSWFIDWGMKTPEGYSSLVAQPFNRFELPFLNTSGIIDSDKVHLMGSLPFFIVKGWSGILKAGTVFAQVIPFKREDWSSEISIEDPINMNTRNRKNALIYRVPDGGVYKNTVWSRRKYE